MVSTVIALVMAAGLLVGGAQNARADEQEAPPSLKWSFAGPFGKFDRGALQRGLKVYKEVCSNCHALSYIAFRNLSDAGGPAIRWRRRRPLPPTTRSRTARTTRATCSSGRGAPRTISFAIPERTGGAGEQWRRGAAGPVADHESAFLRARLPMVHLRLLHAVPGAGAELRCRDPAGL